MIGQSPAMVEVYRMVDRICGQELPVLIRGATGTGKELVARALHRRSARGAARRGRRERVAARPEAADGARDPVAETEAHALLVNAVLGLDEPFRTTILLRSAIYGTCAVLQDGFDVDAVSATLREGAATVTSLVPTQLTRLLDAGAELSAARVNLVGGGPVGVDALERARADGAKIVQTYGLTEAASQVTTLAPGPGGNRLMLKSNCRSPRGAERRVW